MLTHFIFQYFEKNVIVVPSSHRTQGAFLSLLLLRVPANQSHSPVLPSACLSPSPHTWSQKDTSAAASCVCGFPTSQGKGHLLKTLLWPWRSRVWLTTGACRKRMFCWAYCVLPMVIMCRRTPLQFSSVFTMKTPKSYIAVLLLDQILIQKSQVNNT